MKVFTTVSKSAQTSVGPSSVHVSMATTSPAMDLAAMVYTLPDRSLPKLVATALCCTKFV